MTVKIVAFEGSDYSGKTTMIAHFAKRFAGRKMAFNRGPIYPTQLTGKLGELAEHSTEAEKEILYTTIFGVDTIESVLHHSGDERTIFQDRYWQSVISYGRFLNGENSVHNHRDYRGLFIVPDATVVLACSIDEKLKRSASRGKDSAIDKILLKNPEEFDRLEHEIERSLEGLPHVLRFDTSHRSVEEVASQIEQQVAFLLPTP